jgi:sterol desaturase/sphingolipid hydroxylase (fatty acid hydroxylase superfamily)
MKAKMKPRMFKNPIMELLSLSGPILMVSYHLIVSSILLSYGYNLLHLDNSMYLLIGLFFSGIICWTLAEYILHRYLFHLESENSFIKAFHYAMHGYHHEKPNDVNRLFMPPVPVTLFLIAFFGLFYLIMGKYVWIFLPGFEIGYLMYSFIHYSIHTRNSPKLLQRIWSNHVMHHYGEADKAFGVSSILWDKIFSTLPQASVAQNVKTEENKDL